MHVDNLQIHALQVVRKFCIGGLFLSSDQLNNPKVLKNDANFIEVIKKKFDICFGLASLLLLVSASNYLNLLLILFIS